jgi:dolichyl-phosphate beta-glucosyltransferase
MLEECLSYLESKCKGAAGKSKFSYEVIIVNDGSKDGTSRLALEYSKKYGTDKIRLLDFVKNRGKGGAVRMVSIISSFSIY